MNHHNKKINKALFGNKGSFFLGNNLAMGRFILSVLLGILWENSYNEILTKIQSDKT